jgi:hypothetical protein
LAGLEPKFHANNWLTNRKYTGEIRFIWLELTRKGTNTNKGFRNQLFDIANTGWTSDFSDLTDNRRKACFVPVWTNIVFGDIGKKTDDARIVFELSAEIAPSIDKVMRIDLTRRGELLHRFVVPDEKVDVKP